MSGQEQLDDSEQPNTDWDKVVTIDQLLAAACRHPDRYPRPASAWGNQAVVIDTRTDEVLATYDEMADAVRDFYLRMDEDPLVIGYVRLANVSGAGGVRTRWPSEMTELERARVLETDLVHFKASPAEIIAGLGNYLLRGQQLVIKATAPIRHYKDAVELWWPDATGERQAVGYLIKDESDGWRLHSTNDELRPLLLPETVEEGIAAEARWLLGNQDITAEDVREVRHSRYDGKPVVGFPATVLAYGVELAYRFDLLDSLGGDLEGGPGGP